MSRHFSTLRTRGEHLALDVPQSMNLFHTGFRNHLSMTSLSLGMMAIRHYYINQAGNNNDRLGEIIFTISAGLFSFLAGLIGYYLMIDLPSNAAIGKWRQITYFLMLFNALLSIYIVVLISSLISAVV